MIKLSQRDPKWANDKLGLSSLTVGRYGCTTTCISMLSDYFGSYASPKIIAAHANYYTADGLVLWKNLQFKAFNFVERLFGFNESRIDASLKDPKTAVILEVDNSHWVVAIGKVPFTHIYRIADPWDGKTKFSTAYRRISGSAHFIRTK